MSGGPHQARPRSIRELESIVGRYATAEGLAPGRVRRSISFTVIAAVLERVRAYDGTPAFVIRGGVAIERRLEGRPRTTKDFDTVFRSPGLDLIDALDEAFRAPYDGWTLRRDSEPEDLGKALRINVKIDFEGHSWGTVPLEVSEPEGTVIPPENVPAFDLSPFGLNGPETLPYLAVRRQVAQKLHAVTAPPPEGKENNRFRDLLDVWRLRTAVPVDPELRSECKQVFRLRRTHPWPPSITVYDSWPAALKRLAADEGIDFPDAYAAAGNVGQFIASIEATAARVFAREFSEIPAVLSQNTDLRDGIYALVASEPIEGKMTEGGTRLVRFREIMERLVSGEIDLAEAVHRTGVHLASDDSPHRWSRRVFPKGWAERLVRTQYSRFYNQGVLGTLLAQGAAHCFVPHSSAEDPGSPCSVHMAGREHDVRSLYDGLVAAYGQGLWDQQHKIPDHHYCTHVVVPLSNP